MDNVAVNARKVKEGFVGEKRIVLPPDVKRRILGNSLIKNFYLTAIGYYPQAAYHDMERKTGCDQYILIYCVGGEGVITIHNDTYELTPNTYFLIPKNTPHHYYAAVNNPWTIYWVHFCGTYDEQLYQRALVNSALCVRAIPYDHGRIRLFDQIYELLERSYEDQDLEILNLNLLHFVSSIIYYKETAKKTGEEDHVGGSISFMKQYLSQQFSIDQLARQQHISVSHYTRIFRQRTGHTPISFFNQLKIQQSCQFLYFTDKTIKEICVELGFEDPFYFSRLFAKLMGMSPSQYRKTHKSIY